MKELSGVQLMRHNKEKYGTPIKTQVQNGLLAFLFLPIMFVTVWLGETTNVLTALMFMGGSMYALTDYLHKRETTPLNRLEGRHEQK